MIFKLSFLFLLLSILLLGNSKNTTSYDSSLFTQKEIEWLKKTKTLQYVYDPDWAPFEWTNKLGLHTGIIADIIKIIEKKTHIDFIAENTNTWAESVELVQNKKINIFSAITPNSKRSDYLNFTQNDIVRYSAVMIANFNDKTVYLDVHTDLKNKKIGIIKDNGLGDYVKDKYKNLNFIVVDTTQAGLDMVKNNKIDLLAINAMTARYFIEKRYFNSLKIAMKLNYTYHLKMGVNKEIPKILVSILDKVLQSISENEFNAIFNKWTSIEAEKKDTVDWVLIIQIVSVFLFIIFLLLMHNRKLHRVVEERTSELKELNIKLQMLADTDSLTGIPNRRKLQNDFNNIVKTNKDNNEKMALCLFDIDNFKPVNDILGHDAGDELLQKISKITSSILNKNEMLYRVGGDEFIIFVPFYKKKEELEYLAKRLIELIPSIYISDDLTVGVSIGVAVFPEDGKELKELIDVADSSMYVAKKNGKNNFYFSSNI